MTATTAAGALQPLRAALGASQLTWPPQTIGRWVGQPIAERTLMVIRLLGGRQLIQAGASQLRPTPSVLTMGALVDGLHAATMVALALRNRPWRRAALGEALLASALATAGAVAARNQSVGAQRSQTTLR